MRMTSDSASGRPVALITGVGRTVGIGAGIAGQLATSGWDIAFTYWSASPQGQWITAQLLYSNGGFAP